MRQRKRSQPSPTVPIGMSKSKSRVGEVGVHLAEVPRLAGGAEERAGDAERLQALALDDADALGALEEDLVLGEERLELVDARGELLRRTP